MKIWIGLEMLALIGMLGFNLFALVHDTTPCDLSTWVFTVASSVVMALQAVLALLLMINLPAPALGSNLRMTWDIYKKFAYSKCAFFASFSVSMVQIALIPAGIAIFKNADAQCFIAPTLTYTYTFYLSLVQCIILVCIAIPVCFMPCCFILYDLPTYHGVSPQTIQRLTTITYIEPTISPPNVYEIESTTTKPSTEAVERVTPLSSRPVWSYFAKPQSTTAVDSAIPVVTEMAQAAEPTSIESALTNTTSASSKPRRSIFTRGSSTRHSTVNETECAICLEVWANGEVIKQMKCGHSYHLDCLTLWLDEHDHW
ncbi:UNVERIFIED_CONTAM: hypothetical protein HDU68_006115 [Siphonaria sp. JEL0065]|nr:hypothetical protein HDU68_006115 [Siphonaria sp. JEL0065]